jgi:hypothetical protein
MTGFSEFQARQIVQRMHRLTEQVASFASHARILRLSAASFDARSVLHEANTLLHGLTASRTDFEKVNAQIGSVSRALSSRPSAGSASPAAQWGNEFRAGSKHFIASVRDAEQELKQLYGEANAQINMPTRTGTAPDTLWDALMVMTDILTRCIEGLKGTKP